MGGKAGKQQEVRTYYNIRRKKLGTGTYAVVKKAVRKADKKEFAIKKIKKTKLDAKVLARVHDEVIIMHKVRHPNCVTLYEVFETKTKMYLVMDLLTGGKLYDRIVAKGSCSEKEVSEIIKSIASGIKYLHENGIVHRDLKPENLIYSNTSDDSLIITDFGLAKYLDQQKGMHTACGTPAFAAPEILKGEGYDQAVDLWSLGVILYLLLSGFSPFNEENVNTLYQEIITGTYHFSDPYWTDISDSAKELVRGLLTVDPKKRMSAVDVLEHPWITGKSVSSKPFDSSYISRIRLHRAISDVQSAL